MRNLIWFFAFTVLGIATLISGIASCSQEERCGVLTDISGNGYEWHGAADTVVFDLWAGKFRQGTFNGQQFGCMGIASDTLWIYDSDCWDKIGPTPIGTHVSYSCGEISFDRDTGRVILIVVRP